MRTLAVLARRHVPRDARDQVRVARRLEDLPELAAAFADGRVSYSKVRAITRVAEPDDGLDWIGLARSSSAAQLDMLVRGVSRARAHEAARADPAQAAWRLRTRVRYDEDGSFVLTVRGPAQLLPVVQAGLDAKRAQLQRERAAAVQDVPVTVEPPPLSSALSPVLSPAAEPPEASSLGGRDEGSDLDTQAEGWPTGTTRRQVLEAADRLTALHRDLGPRVRLGPAGRWRAAATVQPDSGPEDPAGPRRRPEAAPTHLRRPSPVRPRP